MEAALESIRQTVTTSLSARSQVVTDQESEVDHDYCTTSASRIQQFADVGNQGENVDLDTSHVRDNGQETNLDWFSSQTSLRERTSSEVFLANSHIVNEVGPNDLPTNQSRASFHRNKISL